MFFSKTTGAFYAAELLDMYRSQGVLPSDLVSVSPARRAELTAGEALGMRIVGDAEGNPQLEAPPPPGPEQLREAAKVARANAVLAIKVTTQAGNTFDGDEVSQGRMARAIIALQATSTPTVNWTLADNTVIAATAAELTEALALAGAAQASVWVLPA